jgi:hypothetical protein
MADAPTEACHTERRQDECGTRCLVGPGAVRLCHGRPALAGAATACLPKGRA